MPPPSNHAFGGRVYAAFPPRISRGNPDPKLRASPAAIRFSRRQICLDYRHTFGSQVAMKRESLYKISTLMGNSAEICRRHYAAIVPEQMRDSVEFGQPFVLINAMRNEIPASINFQTILD
jgi:hypothetical protein